MTSSSVHGKSLVNDAGNRRQFLGSNELVPEHKDRFMRQVTQELPKWSNMRITVCPATSSPEEHMRDMFRTRQADSRRGIDSNHSLNVQASNSQTNRIPKVQIDIGHVNNPPDLEVANPLRLEARRELSVATSDYDVSQETANMTSPTCASSSQGYKSLSSSVTDIARPVRVCTACGGAGPPPGHQRLPGGCQKYTSPNWKGFRRILKLHRRRAAHALPQPVDCGEQIHYPYDYTCVAMVFIFIAPLCGLAALFFSLRMRSSTRAGNAISAWKYSNCAFVFIVIGGMCLVLVVVIPPMAWLLGRRQTGLQPSTPLPMIAVPMPTLSRDDLIKRNRHTDVLPPFFVQGNEGLIPVRDPYNTSQSTSQRISSVS